MTEKQFEYFGTNRSTVLRHRRLVAVPRYDMGYGRSQVTLNVGRLG